MAADETTTTTTTVETKAGSEGAPTTHHDLAQWRGKRLIDRDGEKIGKLEDVYVDADTEEPMFGTLKEGHFGRHLTFVPLRGTTIGPDDLQVVVTRQQVKDAPNVDSDGQALSDKDELLLYHHYKVDYTPRDTESGRRLVRR